MDQLLPAGIHPGSVGWSEAQRLREGAGSLGTGGVHQCEAGHQLRQWPPVVSVVVATDYCSIA